MIKTTTQAKNTFLILGHVATSFLSSTVRKAAQGLPSTSLQAYIAAPCAKVCFATFAISRPFSLSSLAEPKV